MKSELWDFIGSLGRGEELHKVPGTNKCLWTILAEREIYCRAAGGCSGVYGAFEVGIGSWALDGYRSKHRTDRVDFMTINTLSGECGTVKCYELKATASDLRSKAQLSFVGDLNYLLVHPQIADAAVEFAPEHVGVMVYGRLDKCDGRWMDSSIYSVKHAKRTEPQISAAEARQLMFRSMACACGQYADTRAAIAADRVRALREPGP